MNESHFFQSIHVSAWSIDTLSLLSDSDYVKLYTIFDERHVYGSRDEIVATFGKDIDIQNYVFFRPERLLLHAIIVEYSCRVQCNNEIEMVDNVHQLYKVGTRFYKQWLSNLGEKFEQDFKSNFNKERINNIKVAYQIVSDTVSTISEKIIDNFLKKTNKKILVPEPKNRVTGMLAGGQASGKGSSAILLEKEMIKKGVNLINVVRINTDSYKPLVLKPGTVDKFKYSQLAQPEASLIHRKVFERLYKLAEEGRAPHVLVDQVFVGEDKIKFAQLNGGTAMITVVSTDVISAVERSFARGMQCGRPELGRFEHTEGILSCHKRFAQQLPETLSKFVDSDTKVNIIDNNVPLGEDPNIAAIICLGEDSGKAISILNKDGMKSLVRKTYINESARNAEEVYPENLLIEDKEVISYLKVIPIEVLFELDNQSQADVGPQLG